MMSPRKKPASVFDTVLFWIILSVAASTFIGYLVNLVYLKNWIAFSAGSLYIIAAIPAVILWRPTKNRSRREKEKTDASANSSPQATATGGADAPRPTATATRSYNDITKILIHSPFLLLPAVMAVAARSPNLGGAMFIPVFVLKFHSRLQSHLLFLVVVMLNVALVVWLYLDESTWGSQNSTVASNDNLVQGDGWFELANISNSLLTTFAMCVVYVFLDTSTKYRRDDSVIKATLTITPAANEMNLLEAGAGVGEHPAERPLGIRPDPNPANPLEGSLNNNLDRAHSMSALSEISSISMMSHKNLADRDLHGSSRMTSPIVSHVHTAATTPSPATSQVLGNAIHPWADACGHRAGYHTIIESNNNDREDSSSDKLSESSRGKGPLATVTSFSKVPLEAKYATVAAIALVNNNTISSIDHRAASEALHKACHSCAKSTKGTVIGHQGPEVLIGWGFNDPHPDITVHSPPISCLLEIRATLLSDPALSGIRIAGGLIYDKMEFGQFGKLGLKIFGSHVAKAQMLMNLSSELGVFPVLNNCHTATAVTRPVDMVRLSYDQGAFVASEFKMFMPEARSHASHNEWHEQEIQREKVLLEIMGESGRFYLDAFEAMKKKDLPTATELMAKAVSCSPMDVVARKLQNRLRDAVANDNFSVIRTQVHRWQYVSSGIAGEEDGEAPVSPRCTIVH